MNLDSIVKEISIEAKKKGVYDNPEALMAFAIGYHSASSRKKRRLDSAAIPPPLTLRENGTLVPSEAEKAIHLNKQTSEAMVATLYNDDDDDDDELATYEPEIKGCVFTGHTNTDMDSIASAIGAAHLYSGVAARSSDVNAETKFCLKRWGMELPKAFEDVVDDASKRGVVMVDHNQTNQSPACLNQKTVRGVIDHHALQSNTVQTGGAIFTDIRPWGSCCSIITSHYLSQKVKIPRKIAGMLLSGILSDTLNLQSPTTTNHDRKMLSVLAHIADVNGRDAINRLANEQFNAKSDALLEMTCFEIYHGDAKRFSFRNKKFSGTVYWGTCEFKGDKYMNALLKKIDEFQYEMRAFKKEKCLSFMFLSLVDIENLRTVLVVADEASRILANEAFTGKKMWRYDEKNSYLYDCKPIKKGESVLELPKGYVSRKKTFIPPLKGTIQDAQWAPPLDVMKPDNTNYAPVVRLGRERRKLSGVT